MKSYTIYRTQKGNLTFKESKTVAFTVHARSDKAAEEMLKQLKTMEKSEKIDPPADAIGDGI